MKFNSNDKKKVLIALGVVLGLVGVITLSYAFLSVGGKQSLANTFRSGCLNITIDSESNAIGLSNVLPVTDVEGLSTEGYSFTVKNTCSTSADFIVNLENLNRQTNTLSSDYLKVSISGDTFDNIVSILSSNPAYTPSISNGYETYTIYTGSIEGNSTRNFKIREWLDYDATKEQAASKVITNKINVIAKSDIEVTSRPEVKQNIKLTKMLGNITGNVSSAKYCVTENKICTPNKEVTIENNKTTIELEIKDEKQVVCLSLDNGKVMCSDPSIAKGKTIQEEIIADSKGLKTTFTGKATLQDTGIYEAPDDFTEITGKNSYYFRGLSGYLNNWVKFGKWPNDTPDVYIGYSIYYYDYKEFDSLEDCQNDTDRNRDCSLLSRAGQDMYWRIVRINGNGSIRMIYSGTDVHKEGPGTAINSSIINNHQDGNTDVGYMISDIIPSTNYENAHNNKNDSIIKKVNDSWYKENILNSNLEKYIDTSNGYCNERTVGTDPRFENLGYGSSPTGYASMGRFFYNGNWRTTQTPSLQCTNKERDLFTSISANIGNRKLQYPIGLITSDEIIFAGAFANGSDNSYIYISTKNPLWTISPGYTGTMNTFSKNFNDYIVNSSLSLSGNFLGVRPVINLKPDTIFTEDGNGSLDNPYIVLES